MNKSKKELLLFLINELGLQQRLEKQGLMSELESLDENLSNLSEFPHVSTVLTDRSYLQNLVDSQNLAPCVLMQSLHDTAIQAGVESYQQGLWEALEDQDSLLGIIEKIFISIL